jgi:hypothetical protein
MIDCGSKSGHWKKIGLHTQNLLAILDQHKHYKWGGDIYICLITWIESSLWHECDIHMSSWIQFGFVDNLWREKSVNLPLVYHVPHQKTPKHYKQVRQWKINKGILTSIYLTKLNIPDVPWLVNYTVYGVYCHLLFGVTQCNNFLL